VHKERKLLGHRFVWMMVSFASVTGCQIDEPLPKLSVPENDIYEF
jgi:hypothetical protein